MTIEDAIRKLDEQELREFAYGHALGTLNYEGNTIAPRDSRIPRGRTVGILAGEIHKLSTDADAIKLMDFLREHLDELSPKDRRRVELREKSLKRLRRIPKEEYAAHAALVNEASAVWNDAKARDDYALFEPLLGRIIDADKHFAELVEPDMDPYDYLLDEYEEGLTREKCDAFFSALRKKIVPLVEKVKNAPQPDMGCTKVPFPKSAQMELAYKLMDTIGIDRNRCSLGETEHPFTSGFTKYDVRITTNYKDNFLSSFFSVIHEGGHALYEQNIDDDLSFTSLNGGVSMSVHESQSRFYENIIGRSPEFMALMYPEIVRLCPELSKWSAEEIYRASVHAEPSLIRTEADELTYCLHIMVRYEMERAFIDGSVPAKELPDMWNALYKEYLGIDVPNYRSGILQDSHWSNDLIGYFPSYALGSAYAAQMFHKMRETVDVKRCVAAGDFAPIADWLRERIWKYGCLVPPVELVERAFEEPFNPEYYTDYLERKMADVYGI